MSLLSKVAISIKTLLRDNFLYEAVDGALSSMPECQLIITDDGHPTPAKSALYRLLRAKGHVIIELPFDSGFGQKSNAAAAACEREFLLVASDDFDLRPRSVRDGVERLARVLEGGVADVASGRVNGSVYEGWLDDYGDRIVEHYISHKCAERVDGIAYHRCDLTVNYSLIRRSVLGPDKLHWFGDVKIGGGEHGALFVMAKRLGIRTVYVPGVDVREQTGKPVDPRYLELRGRARRPGRRAFELLGIKEYVLFDGTVERA